MIMQVREIFLNVALGIVKLLLKSESVSVKVAEDENVLEKIVEYGNNIEMFSKRKHFVNELLVHHNVVRTASENSNFLGGLLNHQLAINHITNDKSVLSELIQNEDALRFYSENNDVLSHAVASDYLVNAILDNLERKVGRTAHGTIANISTLIEKSLIQNVLLDNAEVTYNFLSKAMLSPQIYNRFFSDRSLLNHYNYHVESMSSLLKEERFINQFVEDDIDAVRLERLIVGYCGNEKVDLHNVVNRLISIGEINSLLFSSNLILDYEDLLIKNKVLIDDISRDTDFVHTIISNQNVTESIAKEEDNEMITKDLLKILESCNHTNSLVDFVLKSDDLVDCIFSLVKPHQYVRKLLSMDKWLDALSQNPDLILKAMRLEKFRPSLKKTELIDSFVKCISDQGLLNETYAKKIMSSNLMDDTKHLNDIVNNNARILLNLIFENVENISLVAERPDVIIKAIRTDEFIDTLKKRKLINVFVGQTLSEAYYNEEKCLDLITNFVYNSSQISKHIVNDLRLLNNLESIFDGQDRLQKLARSSHIILKAIRTNEFSDNIRAKRLEMPLLKSILRSDVFVSPDTLEALLSYLLRNIDNVKDRELIQRLLQACVKVQHESEIIANTINELNKIEHFDEYVFAELMCVQLGELLENEKARKAVYEVLARNKSRVLNKVVKSDLLVSLLLQNTDFMKIVLEEFNNQKLISMSFDASFKDEEKSKLFVKGWILPSSSDHTVQIIDEYGKVVKEASMYIYRPDIFNKYPILNNKRSGWEVFVDGIDLNRSQNLFIQVCYDGTPISKSKLNMNQLAIDLSKETEVVSNVVEDDYESKAIGLNATIDGIDLFKLDFSILPSVDKAIDKVSGLNELLERYSLEHLNDKITVSTVHNGKLEQLPILKNYSLELVDPLDIAKALHLSTKADINYVKYIAQNNTRVYTDYKMLEGIINKEMSILDVGGVPPLLAYYLCTNEYKNLSVADLNIYNFEKFFTEKNVQMIGLDLLSNFNLDEVGTYDCICLSEVIEHLTGDLNSIISKISKLVKKGGYLFITTPNVSSLTGVFALTEHKSLLASKYTQSVKQQYDRVKEWGYYGHVREYTSKEVIDLITESGYELIKFETIPDYRVSEESSAIDKLLYVLESRLQYHGLFGKYLFRKV